MGLAQFADLVVGVVDGIFGGKSQKPKNDEDIQFLRNQLAIEQKLKQENANSAAEVQRRMEAVEELNRRLEARKLELEEANNETQLNEKIRQDARADDIRREDREERKRQDEREDLQRERDIKENIRKEEREDKRRREEEEFEAARKAREETWKADAHKRQLELDTLHREYDAKEKAEDRELEKWKITQQAELYKYITEAKVKMIKHIVDKMIESGYAQDSFAKVFQICMSGLETGRLSLTPNTASNDTDNSNRAITA